MSDRPDLLNAKEFSEKLGIGHSTWAKRKKRGWTKPFEVARPIGQRRYSRQRVEQFLAGESVTQLGRTR